MRIGQTAVKCDWAREHGVGAAWFGRTGGIVDVPCPLGGRAMDVPRARLSLRRSRHDT